MSLTGFLKEKDVKQEFNHLFPKPKFALEKEILAPPRTKQYLLVGVAFDYLLRFYLQRLNATMAVVRSWVAEQALSPSSPILQDVSLYVNTGEVSFTETDLTKKIRKIIDQAKLALDHYLSSGKMTDELIESALYLAQIEPIVRSGYVDPNIGIINKENVVDLRNMISVIRPGIFTAKDRCILNPTFGEASKLVGGADADLLIDDLLIDIKTTKDLKLTQDYFNQLVGYYVLYKINEMQNPPPTTLIERVGIYYSRYSEFFIIPIADIVGNMDFSSFIEWFKEKAASKYPPLPKRISPLTRN